LSRSKQSIDKTLLHRDGLDRWPTAKATSSFRFIRYCVKTHEIPKSARTRLPAFLKCGARAGVTPPVDF